MADTTHIFTGVRDDDWHVVHVISVEDDGWDIDILHPPACRVYVSSPPDEWHGSRWWECVITDEVEHVGWDTIFGHEEPPEPGWYFVRVFYFTVQSIEHGTEADSEISVWRMEPPEQTRIDVSRIKVKP